MIEAAGLLQMAIWDEMKEYGVDQNTINYSSLLSKSKGRGDEDEEGTSPGAHLRLLTPCGSWTARRRGLCGRSTDGCAALGRRRCPLHKSRRPFGRSEVRFAMLEVEMHIYKEDVPMKMKSLGVWLAIS